MPKNTACMSLALLAHIKMPWVEHVRPLRAMCQVLIGQAVSVRLLVGADRGRPEAACMVVRRGGPWSARGCVRVNPCARFLNDIDTVLAEPRYSDSILDEG